MEKKICPFMSLPNTDGTLRRVFCQEDCMFRNTSGKSAERFPCRLINHLSGIWRSVSGVGGPPRKWLGPILYILII